MQSRIAGKNCYCEAVRNSKVVEVQNGEWRVSIDPRWKYRKYRKYLSRSWQEMPKAHGDTATIVKFGRVDGGSFDEVFTPIPAKNGTLGRRTKQIRLLGEACRVNHGVQ